MASMKCIKSTKQEPEAQEFEEPTPLAKKAKSSKPKPMILDNTTNDIKAELDKLQKKYNRVVKSREEIKKKSTRKSMEIKALSGTVSDLKNSREDWKRRRKEREELARTTLTEKEIEIANLKRIIALQDLHDEIDRQEELKKEEVRQGYIEEFKKNFLSSIT